MPTRIALLTGLGLSLLAMGLTSFGRADAQDDAEKKKDAGEETRKERLFELRTYITHPNRLDALNQRFRDHTNRLFEKHGMDLIAYWTPTDGPEAENTLIYVLAYPDREAREASWKAFLNDPDWKKAYEASHRDGPIVMNVESKFLAPTDYSPIR
jgi:hypothetical protein